MFTFVRGLWVLSIAAIIATASTGCQTAQPPTSGLEETKLRALDGLIEQAIDEHRVPGAVLWLERNNEVYEKAYGKRALTPREEPMTTNTIFDAASLTKVLATTPGIMLLIERGEIDLDAPVTRYIEEFYHNNKGAVTVRNLMTHTSGLRSGLNPRPTGASSAIQMACQEKLVNPPGTKFLYSDINFILLGEIVHRVSGRALQEFAQNEIYKPLKMKETRYLPPREWWPRIAPTERDGTNMLRGVVHDPTARRMEGVAGHAGLFTTASDVARFCRMMLNQGELDGVKLFKPETVRLMTSVQSPPAIQDRRGLGWDIDTGYTKRGELFPVGAYGHTGWTGTALLIDPFSKTFWIFMSNRVHPDGKGDVRTLERQISTLCAQAIKGFDFEHVSGALPARSTNQVNSLNGLNIGNDSNSPSRSVNRP